VEGKETLVATLAAYTECVSGKGCSRHTLNDYLAAVMPDLDADQLYEVSWV